MLTSSSVIHKSTQMMENLAKMAGLMFRALKSLPSERPL